MRKRGGFLADYSGTGIMNQTLNIFDKRISELEAHFMANQDAVLKLIQHINDFLKEYKPLRTKYMDRILSMPIEDYNLSVRTMNCLKAADINTLGDLLSYKKKDLLRYRNFGKRSLSEIESFVENLGLEWDSD